MATKEHCAELARQLRVVIAVGREVGRALPPETPPATVAALTILGRHGEMRMSRLAEYLDVDMSVTSRHVAHLVERGWIDRTPDALDRRSRLLRLNPHGEKVLAASSDRAAEVLAAHLSDWSDDDVDQLTGLLDRLRLSFGDCRTGAHAHPPRTHAN
ncbi:MarR family winged helix-turn-helix transcriptional regulator [Streptomyces sp. H10-C2]|uniref:MarR family winged helix-turn-helix transcriptional regulator n=1 Tax=unclassified Streptomyces TaxID=2593676 RepID=UPI0024B93FC2|nr:MULTISPECIES: MarR family winged helix-turn-helix transcriptional regulator [unclassified Streptomyces]MDJ0342116.1 MarR family winged helix-turn-helix transcriptional regulator [Streptomyces sp. PH10-H1]MDJ0368458.1 MarR family winged helix-turn-helix transcriptional regulator [Streptomyces sp. H10-C2]